MNRSKKIVNMAMEVNRKRRAHELLETQKETQEPYKEPKIGESHVEASQKTPDKGSSVPPLVVEHEAATNSPNIETDDAEESEFDDSESDPNYVLTNQSSSGTETDPDIDILAKQLETNLMSVDQHVESETNDDNLTNSSRKSIQRNRNLGKAYKTRKGKTVPNRNMHILTNCQKKCKDKISPMEQQSIFKQYWELGNFNLRVAYASGTIYVQQKKTAVQVKNTNSPRNRIYSYKYYLTIYGQKIQVCQKYFKNTLGETDRFLRTVINKKLQSPRSVTALDLRGKSTPSNKISENRIQKIIDHINSFPAYESHYTRKKSMQKYFHCDLNLSLMYKLYVQINENPVSLSKYSEVFQTQNIKFKHPKIDTCTKCDTLKAKIDLAKGGELEKLKEEQERHHAAADLAYQSKKDDIAKAKECSSTKVFAFDLQQVLPTPYVQSNVSYYKRQLNVYNLTIHDCTSGIPTCFMWDEATAKRGGNDIASCVSSHLQNLTGDVEFVTYYSDNCFGQNKNSLVAAMFAIHSVNNDKIKFIDHTFLDTLMECDVDHSMIERKKKKTSMKIHHPHDWYQFVRGVGVRNPFVVHEMSQSDFRDFSVAAKNKFTFRKVDECGNKVNWREIKWLRYPNKFGVIYFKNSLNDEEPFKTLNIQKRGCNSVKLCNIPLCYLGKNKISEAKKSDLLSLLDLIDPQFHDFYRNLPTENMPDYHPNITEEDDSDAAENDG